MKRDAKASSAGEQSATVCLARSVVETLAEEPTLEAVTIAVDTRISYMKMLKHNTDDAEEGKVMEMQPESAKHQYTAQHHTAQHYEKPKDGHERCNVFAIKNPFLTVRVLGYVLNCLYVQAGKTVNLLRKMHGKM